MPTLSDRKIRDAKTGDSDKWIADGGGLYIRIRANGTRTWVIRRMKAGKASSETIGEWPALDCRAAREAFARKSFSIDTNRLTFGDLLDEWYKDRIEQRYRVTKNIRTYVDRAKAEFGSTVLARLETAPLVRWLKAYAKDMPVAANRCQSNLKLALNYAVECGYLKTNPLGAVTNRVIGGEEKTRDRVLTDDEIRTVWAWNHKLLRLLLLTGLRISEGQQGYLDGDKFRIDRTKNNDPHWVHLPTLAKAQVAKFDTSPTAVQSWTKRHCDKAGIAPFTPHDLRRTFATRLADLDILPHVIERCLNHRMQGVAAIYNRHDFETERIQAAEDWCAAIEKIINAAPTEREIHGQL